MSEAERDELIKKYQDNCLIFEKTIIKNFSIDFNKRYIRNIDRVSIRTNDILRDLFKRVDQEKDYYKLFHATKLSQLHISALSVYWILRFRVLSLSDKAYGCRNLSCKTIADSKSDEDLGYDYDINVYFAYFFLLSEAFKEMLDSQPKDIKLLVMKDIIKKHKKSFLRALNEYNIAKEALILLSESLKYLIEYAIESEKQKKEIENLNAKIKSIGTLTNA